MALEDAGLSPTDIGYTNAHGTATRLGDVVGTNAITASFCESATRVAVSSAKALHGHLMGPTGLVEILAALIAMRESVILAAANLRIADPECDLDYVPNVARTNVSMNAVMSNSFAFGGNNAVLIAKRVV